MSHTVRIVDFFGDPYFQLREYQGISNVDQVLEPDIHLPRLDVGKFDNQSWILNTFDENDEPALIVDDAAAGDHGFFDLTDLRTGPHYRARLQEILQK